MLNKSIGLFILFHSTALFWTTLISSMVLLVTLMFTKDQYPLNMYLLAAFTFVMAIDIGVVCASFAALGLGEIVLEACGITTVVFLSLTAFAWQSSYDFTVWSGLMLALLTSLTAWGLICAIFGYTTGSLYAWFGTIIFSGYVVIDTQMILHKYGPRDYVMAAISLYLDIINLFLYILRMLAAMSGSQDRD